MIKTMGYYIFAFVYYLCRLFPLKDDWVLCIMTHDDGESSNVSLVVRELKKHEEAYKFYFIRKTDTISVEGFKDIKKILSFFILKPYQMARSRVILMDNVFLPMAFFKVKKNVKVIQLWHGTGTIKKFGQDVNTGRLKVLERRANQNITHLIVNSEKTGKLYAKIFGVDFNKVYPLGLPKTDDILYRKWRIEKEGSNYEREVVYKKYNLPPDKKLVLYAPTFRDKDLSSEVIINKVKELALQLPKDYILGLRLHPFVAGMVGRTHIENAYDLSHESNLALLIMASDLLITDYSSIIFEYCITEKPMIFYAYDLEEFSDHGRGFYEDYQSYVPGPVVRTCKELIDIISRKDYSKDRIRDFNADNFSKLDGKARERIINLIKL